MRKLLTRFLGNNMELRERIFRLILLVALVMSILGIAEGFVLDDNGVMSIPLAVLFLAVIVSLIATYKFRLIEFSAWVIGIVIILGIFPLVFFTSGGIEGGATSWFMLGIIYVFLMFSGWKMYLLLTISVGVDVATYLYGYFHPEAIHPLASEALVYLDSVFAVIIIGISSGLIMKYQALVYGKEKEITQKQKDELEKVSNSKNIFFAKMSHEIRTPINAIIGLNEMNLRENLSQEAVENCVSIQNASELLLGLVNEVLDLSQIETKRMTIYEEEYSTRELFYNLVDLMQIRMKKKNLDFIVDVDEYMPIMLKGDEKRITQILINILTNAVKYTKEGSVTMVARAEVSENQKTWLVVSVKDTGVGIRKEDMQYLYDYFHRMDEGHNHKVEGSGLGLSITKQLVEMMGGKITVDSIYTKGSTFTVRIEQEIVDEAPIGKVNFLSRARGNDSGGYQPSFEAPEARILIVDDNSMNLTVAQKLLRDTKVRIDTAESGMEALSKTQKKYYHIIFLDYMMPEFDGMETLRAIRKQENGMCNETPIVCLTGNSRSQAQIINMEYVFDSFLQKPVRGEMFEAEILKFLPGEIVEYRRNPGEEIPEAVNPMFYASRRKKKICITTDCICDLPQEYIDKFGIRLIYLYIETENGRFRDTKEIDSNNISRYLTSSSSQVNSISADVSDYEAFFADELTEAEDVIHLSLAQNTGNSYGCALAAAQGFDHVHVFDSGTLSCGLAIMVLFAAKRVQEGADLETISSELEEIKGNISSRFLLPSAQIFYEKGYTNALVAKLCGYFHIHPVLSTRHSKLKIVGIQTGSIESARRRFIAKTLRFKRHINTDIVYITHVACSVKELEFILREIRRHVEFEGVIVERSSVSNACNAGVGTIGIAFYKKT